MHPKHLLVGILIAVLAITSHGIVAAQQGPAAVQQKDPSDGDYSFAIANILPSGQPVIPIFESWYSNADGTISLSYGYLNMNSQQELYIPIGPDNFLEPKTYNGMQPTHFDVAPKDRNRFSRHQSVFVVKIPKDYKGDVVWTLRVKGQTYSSPGRTKSGAYGIDELDALTESPVAAALTFGASGAPGRGRSAFMGGPLKATVGQPLPLTVGVDLLSRPRTTVTWYEHQGAGKIAFEPKEVTLKANGEAATQATFNEPGDYMLRVTALESTAAMEQHCCYTNGYVKVTVSK